MLVSGSLPFGISAKCAEMFTGNIKVYSALHEF
jgi:hypothetical protein